MRGTGYRGVMATVLLLAATGGIVGCAARPSVEEARAFTDEADRRYEEDWIRNERASWVQANFITMDTELLAADANRKLLATMADLASRSTRYDGLELPGDVARKLKLVKLSLALAAPPEPEEQKELTQIATSMESTYGKGKYCPQEPGPVQGRETEDCRDLGELSTTMAESRDPGELLDAWRGWRTISVPMRDDYGRFVELANEGARSLGFEDLGAMWRSKYDMPPDEFAAEVDRLWEQVRPLYEKLHCYVRARLAERYGTDVVDPSGPIPAHLLGNMWAQSWSNIYDLVAPPGAGDAYDLTGLIREKKLDPQEMVRYGERFFTSLGFDPLPDTFWERSLFTKPRDREVVCHASAWDVDMKDDLRIKMCIESTAEDFVTIHHELGHDFYYREYKIQPPLFRDSANDGFHEALGDTIALSVTPAYLRQVGLLGRDPGDAGDLGRLMKMALDKVAFLPFGLVVDRWRWDVFSGAVGPGRYNQAWWELRRKYQGIAPPMERSEDDFDPGAKYHVPANVPYMRYFLADILQFQFHRALCRRSGYEGPLDRCSIYGNLEAGRRLKEMMAMGISRPWPDALEALTGERKMDASAIEEYFAPLEKWLDEQNASRTCGW